MADLISEIKRQAAGDIPLQRALIAGAAMEGGLTAPFPRGDAGCAAGPFQIRYWMNPCDAGTSWKGHPISAEAAEDPAQAVTYAIQGLGYRANAAKYENPIDVAFYSERPSRYYSQAQQAAAWAAIAGAFPDGDEDSGMVEQPHVFWVPAHAANYTVGRQGVSPEAVVWHITEGGMPGPWFQNPTSQASTHFGISKQGRIEQYVSLDNTAWANGKVEVSQEQAPELVKANWGINPNLWTISIEHEGTSTDVRAGSVPTPQQEDATAHLTAWLFEDVLFDPAANARPPADRAHIMMHREISPRSRTCPAWNEATHSRIMGKVQALLQAQPPKPTPPPVTDYKAKYIAELHGIIASANDDMTRNAVRKQNAEQKLKAEGL